MHVHCFGLPEEWKDEIMTVIWDVIRIFHTNTCTAGENYDTNCNYMGGTLSPDTDNDRVCGLLDQCPGIDDAIDKNNNNTLENCETLPLSPCSNIILLSGTESFFHPQVSNLIFSQQVNSGTYVKYSAGNNILFLDDFEVKQGTVFETVIQNCQ